MDALMTMQGVATRRRRVRRLMRDLALFSLLFAALVSAARELVWPSLSSVIADATSVWVEVPDDSVEYYRDLGYQEGGQGDGGARFRDLSDYRHVVSIITGPVLWGCYAFGLVAVALFDAARSARDVDRLTAAIAHAATVDGSEASPSLTVVGGRGASPVYGSDGGVSDAWGLGNDLAEARGELALLEERVASRERSARDTEVRKNELVAYLAHDMKTPLTSVVGYLSLLAEEPDLPRDRRERYAGQALDKARRLDGMMDEFFEIARYNVCAISLEREYVDVRMLVEQVADELEPLARSHDVCIEVTHLDGAAKLPFEAGGEAVPNAELCAAGEQARPADSAADEGEEAIAFIDPDKMARTVGNILKNGIAYADANTTVTVRVGRVGAWAVFEIGNRGREISPEHLERIFDKFYRVDSSRGSGRGGVGLGLAIAREIVTAHGGAIEARSERGVTTFSVRVPAEAAR